MLRLPWRQTCLGCHFFVKETRVPGSSTPSPFIVSEAEREKARTGDYSWKADFYSLACDRGVWDEGYGLPAKLHEVLGEKDRGGFCFFWKHHPGMLLPAARQLQERDDQLAKTSTDRRFSAYGLWMTALGLLLNVAARVFENRHWWPFT